MVNFNNEITQLILIPVTNEAGSDVLVIEIFESKDEGIPIGEDSSDSLIKSFCRLVWFNIVDIFRGRFSDLKESAD